MAMSPPARAKMPLSHHIREFRRRGTIAAASVLVAAVVVFVFSDAIIGVLSAPLNDLAARHGTIVSLNFDSVTAGFDMRMRIALAGGLIASMPVWVSQLFLFVWPGLRGRERRYGLWFTAVSIPLFVAGMAVGLSIAPHAVELMAGFVPGGAAQLLTATTYFDFYLKLLLAVGVAFLLPALLVLLNVLGVVSGRSILRGWRVAIVAITVFAALATPSADIVSMLILGGILVLLFFGAAGLSILFDRRASRRAVLLEV
ncbi:twin-arginine translocase subunit TatC [Microbacterium sp. UCD-TDU]|uniref:twin-arginine translocase subunit TatC n=1 Tax=Microbacterium sp. UCD-TDU TaxID=1247714 RepID=UPI0026A7A2F5|nr:twin-arginine translocase subunit TatC [Microbacterium sp. UCD-TDU]